MRVLVIDDSADIRGILRLALSYKAAHEVLEAESGKLGIELALQILPDLILLDVMMPGLSGPETLNIMRAHAALRDTPVLFVTAKVQLSEKEELLALDASGVIEKPIDMLGLLKQIEAFEQR